jgi:hypothetical protein
MVQSRPYSVDPGYQSHCRISALSRQQAED